MYEISSNVVNASYLLTKAVTESLRQQAGGSGETRARQSLLRDNNLMSTKKSKFTQFLIQTHCLQKCSTVKAAKITNVAGSAFVLSAFLTASCCLIVSVVVCCLRLIRVRLHHVNIKILKSRPTEVESVRTSQSRGSMWR